MPTAGARREAPPPSLTAWAAEIEGSLEGTRNDTLNEIVFRAACHGYSDSDSVDSLRKAARSCGLEHDEIDRTVMSALDAARRKWGFPEAWVRLVDDAAASSSPRRRAALYAITAEFARIYMLLPPGQPIGLSSRRLSEVVGLSYQTVSAHLRFLSDGGFLVRYKSGYRGAPDRYELSIPEPLEQKPDTKPHHSSSYLVTTSSERGGRRPECAVRRSAPFGARYLDGTHWHGSEHMTRSPPRGDGTGPAADSSRRTRRPIGRRPQQYGTRGSLWPFRRSGPERREGSGVLRAHSVSGPT